ncbi:MAG: hypothetical protein AB6733_18460 [Clostridiaceae bacterium]
MKKLFSTLVLSIFLVFATCINAFAAPKDDVLDLLKSIGMSSYEGKAEAYLNTISITSEQAQTIISNVEAAKTVSNGETDYRKLTSEQKIQIFSYIKEAANAVGLTAKYSKAADGSFTIVLVDANNNVVASFGGSGNVLANTANNYGTFMAVGSVLVIAAGIMLVVRRRQLTLA